MKLFKKLIAAVSAIAMVATVSSAMLVQAASTNPVFTLSKVAVTGETNTYDVTVSVDTTNCEVGTKMFGLTMKLPLPSDVFTNVQDIVDSYVDEGTGFGETDFTDEMNNPSYNDGLLVVQFLVTKANKAVDADGGAELFTIRLKMAEDVASDYNLATSFVVANVGTTSSNCIDYGYGEGATATVAMTSDEFNTVTFAKTATGGKITVPTNESSTATGDSLVSIKPSDIGGTGDVFTTDDEDFAGEAAVASIANFTPAADTAPTKVKWTIKATPLNGTATTYEKTFDLGATVESAMTIGLIVGYRSAEYSSVEITSGALE